MPSFSSKSGFYCSCPSGTCGMDCKMYRFSANRPSNADKIRDMTDEELAKYIDRVLSAAIPPTHNCSCCEFQNCEECWLDWLKQEAQK